jgi:hypothetical protein
LASGFGRHPPVTHLIGNSVAVILSRALQPVYGLIDPVVGMGGVILGSFTADCRIIKEDVAVSHGVTVALGRRELPIPVCGQPSPAGLGESDYAGILPPQSNVCLVVRTV